MNTIEYQKFVIPSNKFKKIKTHKGWEEGAFPHITHNKEKLRELYPVNIYDHIRHRFRVDVSDTPLYRDLFGGGWEEYVANNK